MILLAAAAGFGIAFALLARFETRAIWIVGLSVPQLFLLSPEIITFSAVVTLTSALGFVSDRPSWDRRYGRFLVAFIALAVLAILWSPDVTRAVAWIIGMLQLLIVFIYVKTLRQRLPQRLPRVFDVLGVAVVIEAGLTAVFRVSPELESRFLHSYWAVLVNGPGKMAAYFTTSPDNVRDVEKAGGLYLNGNTASLYLGMASFLFLCAFTLYKRRRYVLVALAAYLGVFSTGSKTAMILGLLLPVFVVSLIRLAKSPSYLLPILVALPAVAYLAFSQVTRLFPTFAADSDFTFGIREMLWRAAADMFSEHPMLGLGFGGWFIEIAKYSNSLVAERYPPHNIFIQIWSDMGLGAALLLVAFVVVVVLDHYRLLSTRPGARVTAAVSLGAFAWLILHGMADTINFWGDNRIAVLLAFFLGLLAAELERAVDVDDQVQPAATGSHAKRSQVYWRDSPRLTSRTVWQSGAS
ncbi:O-antigen ligase family protein [Micromonospora thermarum]|uniref:O-antigen ligase family protein n=1 Tax=Micromonospora thermarum TaxID=2720024 RepID=A0ABX0Z0A0_9ACTN|nr:O-antigen ligase family protein [Micromonospora thermarum]NJP30804.1 O-antigen ligase family protein [Micromonospora thermarum]